MPGNGHVWATMLCLVRGAILKKSKESNGFCQAISVLVSTINQLICSFWVANLDPLSVVALEDFTL